MTRSLSGRALATATALCLSASLVLTGCGPRAEVPDPAPTTETPAPSPTPEPTPEPSPEPTPEQIVIPGSCDELSPLAASEYAVWVADLDYTEWPSADDADFDRFYEHLGPLSRTASDSALQKRGCSWIVSFHSGVDQWVFELPAGAASDFASTLRSSGYDETVVHGAPVFSWEDRGESAVFEEAITRFDYAFIGDIWVAQVGHNAYYPQYLADVIAVLRIANPGIAP